MSLDSDLGIWKQLGNWLWAALLIPVAALWRKVDGSASRIELHEAITEMKDANKTLRESVVTLFTNAEEDRRRYEERFTKMQQSIHDIHIEVVTKLVEQR